jgi:molybdopterin converting factor subunit 1
MMNHIRILFFATLREKAGTKNLELDVPPGATVRTVKDAIIEQFPTLQENIEHCLASVNHEYSEDTTEIPTNAEIAFFPPVSGGSFQ